MEVPYTHKAVDADEYHKLNNVLSLLFPSTVHVQQSQNINAQVHTLRLLTLSNGGRLLLKGSPLPGTPFYDTSGCSLRPKPASWSSWAKAQIPAFHNFIIMTREGAFLYIKGNSLAEMKTQITTQQRNDIDRHLGFLASTVGQNVAPGFGSLQQVAMGAGKRSWREAFCGLFEGVLRDAEDIFIHLPYAEIRHEVGRLSGALGEVTLPRLVVVGFGRPCHVLLDEKSHQLSGVVDFSTAFWGDILMAELFEDPTPAVLEGAGLPLSRTTGEEIRLLMYSCYRLVSQITLQYYRNRDEATEFDARRRLLATISELVGLAPI
ncbi:hypothetical protein N7454_000557 [Penicillium verhagenii]|nr:hypothetical protein N7454_000557 [Penicillium verhagenii]